MNVANTTRMKEECEKLALYLSKHRGPVVLSEVRPSLLLAGFRNFWIYLCFSSVKYLGIGWNRTVRYCQSVHTVVHFHFWFYWTSNIERGAFFGEDKDEDKWILTSQLHDIRLSLQNTEPNVATLILQHQGSVALSSLKSFVSAWDEEHETAWMPGVATCLCFCFISWSRSSSRHSWEWECLIAWQASSHVDVVSPANHRSKDVVLDQYRAILVRVGWQIAGREFAEDTVMTQMMHQGAM